MADQDGKAIAQGVRANAAGFRKACEVLDEESSSRAPEGRWSPKQIISHLCGPEGKGLLPSLKAFLEKDTPELDIKPEDPHWSGKRSGMSLAELLAEFDREYERIAAFVEGLSEKELLRKAHIPMLKDSPIGEYPTLAQWAVGLSQFHMGFHTDHMREIEQALGLPKGKTA
ncbi:MAG TPA: DinB family protein [Thermodesulfovibrionales bacterium]|nr:DinB family protein [Thermodesulfovibrionales bacterium]